MLNKLLQNFKMEYNINTTDEISKIAIFRQKEIRKILKNGEWWFSVVDVISALTDSNKPRDYWFRMKVRVFEINIYRW